MNWLLFKKICFSWNTADLLWHKGETLHTSPSPAEYSQVAARRLQWSWAAGGQSARGLCLGKEGRKLSGSALEPCRQCCRPSAWARGCLCHVSTPTSPTGNVVNDMWLLPRKLWVHKRTRALDMLNFHFRDRAEALLCCHLTKEAGSALRFQAQSSLKIVLRSLAEVPEA